MVLSSALANSRISSKESVLLNCGNYLAELIEHNDHKIIEVIAIHLYPELLKAIFQTETLPIYNSASSMPNPKIIENSSIVLHYVESLNFYFDNPEIVSSDLIMLKVKELILLLLKTSNASSVQSLFIQLFNKRQESLKGVIQKHLFSSLTIDQLAILSGQSLSSFKRAFQKIFNDSPANYIKMRRLDKAKKLLENPSLTISEVCYQIGYNDVSNFTKTFKKVVGFTPIEYRKNLVTR